MNKKKKSTNTSPYPDEAIDRLARAFYPAILACWNSEEGQREFAAWQAEQAHHTTSKEKQSVPDGERPVIHIAIVCGFLQGASGRAHPVFSLLYIRCTKLRILMGETIPLYRAMTSHFLWASRTMPLHKQGQELRSERTVIPIHEQHNLYLFFCVLTIRKQLPGNDFERSGRGQEPSRGHKFSILENVVLHRDFTSSMHLHFRSDLVGACLPQTLLIFAPCGAKERRVVLT